MAKKVSNTYQGTMAELAATVVLNGKPLSQPFISQLVTYGLNATKVGKQDNKVGKGKPINIVKLNSSGSMKFSLASELVAQSDEAGEVDTNAPEVDATATQTVTAETETQTVTAETETQTTAEAAETVTA